MEVILGIDVGQKRESSALCAVELEEREVRRRRIDHFVVRHLERIASGTRYPEIVRRVGEVVDSVSDRTGYWPNVYVDVTGLGSPIVTLLHDEISGCWVRPVYFTYGDRRTIEHPLDERRPARIAGHVEL